MAKRTSWSRLVVLGAVLDLTSSGCAGQQSGSESARPTSVASSSARSEPTLAPLPERALLPACGGDARAALEVCGVHVEDLPAKPNYSGGLEAKFDLVK